MKAKTLSGFAVLTGAVSALSSGQAVMATDPTEIDDIVMYAVESSSPATLYRYFFRSDEYVPVGDIWTTTGLPVEDVEALSYIGQGPYKGLYGIATDGPTEQHLTRINPLTAEATLYGSDLGGDKIIGMIPDYDAVLGKWYLLASDAGGKLRRVNVANGNASVVANVGRDFEGLARNSEGVIYGSTNTKLYRLDPVFDPDDASAILYNVIEIGSMGLDKAESLEFAFGNAAPPIDIPGVTPSWTTYGVLFVFDDATDAFGILNPDTGQFAEYLFNGGPCAFSNQDAEGMIFVTTLNDPLYGSIDGFD